jgi:hypothetical protein
VGIETSRELARSMAHRSPESFEALDRYALHVFNRRYDTFKLQGRTWFEAHPDALQRSYILLGGTENGDRRFHFHGSESHADRYRHIPTADVLTAPRRIGLEARLTHAARSDAGADALRDIILAGLALIETRERAVSGPFDIALFDDRGRRFETV